MMKLRRRRSLKNDHLCKPELELLKRSVEAKLEI